MKSSNSMLAAHNRSKPFGQPADDAGNNGGVVFVGSVVEGVMGGVAAGMLVWGAWVVGLADSAGMQMCARVMLIVDGKGVSWMVRLSGRIGMHAVVVVMANVE